MVRGRERRAIFRVIYKLAIGVAKDLETIVCIKLLSAVHHACWLSYPSIPYAMVQ